MSGTHTDTGKGWVTHNLGVVSVSVAETGQNWCENTFTGHLTRSHFAHSGARLDFLGLFYRYMCQEHAQTPRKGGGLVSWEWFQSEWGKPVFGKNAKTCLPSSCAAHSCRTIKVVGSICSLLCED